jgi:hypothetical protein
MVTTIVPPQARSYSLVTPSIHDKEHAMGHENGAQPTDESIDMPESINKPTGRLTPDRPVGILHP